MRTKIGMMLALGLATSAVTLTADASAQIDPTPDGIGIYFDTMGEQFCIFGVPYTPVTLYLLATRVSDSTGISGWECALYTNPAVLPAGLTVDVMDCVAGCAPPYLHVSLAAPLPRASAIRLATISTFYLSGSVYFALGAAEPTSFPGDPGPGYSGGDDQTRLRRLTPPIWSEPDPAHDHSWYVAAIGSYSLCTVMPAEPITWGAVKGLYR